MLHEFRMPDAGEGLTEAEVLRWRVAAGDEVVVNQVLLEVETAKAAVELPSPFQGRVVALLAKTGDVVPVGRPIITIDDDLDGSAGTVDDTTSVEEAPGQSLLVGYGVPESRSPSRRPRRAPTEGPQTPSTGSGRAKPGARRLARELGVDVLEVPPTGPHGAVTEDDVAAAAGRVGEPNDPGSARASVSDPDTEVVPRSHVARMMARAMTRSASTAAHVTEWVDVDVTAMTQFLKAARARPEMADLPLTPLTVAALGVVRAARAYPTINSSLDESGRHLLVHHRVHLGIAVDSPRGLIVPRVADAHELDLQGMAKTLMEVIQIGRAGHSRPEDLRGSTITITNIGVFGVDSGTPLLNPGEVAIVALGRSLPRPWVVDGSVTVRDVMTLALSFDHRVVDGALASRVLRHVADFMADPGSALATDGLDRQLTTGQDT